MKKKLSILCTIGMVVGLCGSNIAQADLAVDLAENDNADYTRMTFPVGVEEDELSYFVGEDMNYGPDDFVVFDNKVAFLDVMSNTIKVYSLANGAWLYNIDCVMPGMPVSMEYQEGRFFVLDNNQYLSVYSVGAELLEVVDLCQNAQENMILLEKVDDVIYTVGGFGEYYSLKEMGLASEYLTELEQSLTEEAQLLRKAQIQMDTKAGMIGTGVATQIYQDYVCSADGYRYCLSNEICSTSFYANEISVQKYAQDGTLVGNQVIALEEGAFYYPVDFLNIDAQGNTYVMQCLEDAVVLDCYASSNEIEQSNLAATYETKLAEIFASQDVVENISVLPLVSESAAPTATTATYVYNTRTRSEVLNYAMQYTILSWTLNEANKNLRGADTELPTWIENITTFPTNLRGVPYCNGGTNTCEQFITNIAAGYMAGNIKTSKYNAQTKEDEALSYQGGTAGVDCSGFVSLCYDVPSLYSTTRLATWQFRDKNYPTISWDEICTGDFAVVYKTKKYDGINKKHIMLFHYRKDATTVFVVDSAAKTIGKVTQRAMNMAEMDTDGYTLHRAWATGHVFNSAFKYNETEHWQLCSNNCNQKKNEDSHTLTSVTSTTKVCYTCGYTVTE